VQSIFHEPPQSDHDLIEQADVTEIEHGILMELECISNPSTQELMKGDQKVSPLLDIL